jgi:hypothetical protein
MNIRAAAVASMVGLLGFGYNFGQASEAYGSINNFDVVNDTGEICHGFEIELDDVHSSDITYTYDWNHYGTPKIIEDSSDPGHPRVFVEYQSGKNAGGEWSAYTAIPSSPIAPTQGHQFTNPAVNFGGEHFGVGYSGLPTSIKYHWLLDDGGGNLVLGPAVTVSTPTFTYIPPAVGVPAKLQAVIVPPEVEESVLEFGHASWVKEIRTSTHNNGEVKLRDLVPANEVYPNARNWANDEPAEVETEWQLLQKEFAAGGGGKNGELKGAPEPLEKGDEVVTRRYEFYEYVGPLDPETGEALTDKVAKDGIHGTKTYDQTVIVGKFLGSQMSAAKVASSVGLVDHVQDGEVGVPFPDRMLVIAGDSPFKASRSGALPVGLTFDEVTGMLSGTPQKAGKSSFTIRAKQPGFPAVEQSYFITVAAAGTVAPPHSMVTTGVLPAGAGTATGGGDIENGRSTTVTCTAKPGFVFLNWSEAGVPKGVLKNLKIRVDTNHALVAGFTPVGVKVAQNITFPNIPAQRMTKPRVSLKATASSGLAVSYVLVSGPATLAGHVLTLTGVGTVEVKAKQAGNAGFSAAHSVTQSFVTSS